MIFEKIQQFVAEQFEIPAESISLDSNFIEDIGADSLDVVELISYVEEEFGLSVSDEEVAELTTVAKLVDYIEARQ